MYLSRIQLTPQIANQSQLGLMLRDRNYGIHRLLWDLFESKERFLFREENGQAQLKLERRLPVYYILSKAKPVPESPIFDIDSKPFSPALREGDQLTFRLRANPTVARREDGLKNSKRHDVVMDAKHQFLIAGCKERKLSCEGKKRDLQKSLLDHPDFKSGEKRAEFLKTLDKAVQNAAVGWIKNRGERNGFDVNNVQATGYRWNALPEKARAAGFSSMDYEGVLTVRDSEQFVQMLCSGLGPSKAFGCGLMLIRRCR